MKQVWPLLDNFNDLTGTFTLCRFIELEIADLLCLQIHTRHRLVVPFTQLSLKYPIF